MSVGLTKLDLVFNLHFSICLERYKLLIVPLILKVLELHAKQLIKV